MYRLNDGIVRFYKRLPTKTESQMPVVAIDPLSELRFYYGEIGTSIQEHYEAKLSDIEIEKRIRILHRTGKCVSSQDIAVIGGKRYSVERVAPKVSKEGVKVMDITLVRLEAVFNG